MVALILLLLTSCTTLPVSEPAVYQPHYDYVELAEEIESYEPPEPVEIPVNHTPFPIPFDLDRFLRIDWTAHLPAEDIEITIKDAQVGQSELSGDMIVFLACMFLFLMILFTLSYIMKENRRKRRE